jgi:hypothetical protein
MGLADMARIKPGQDADLFGGRLASDIPTSKLGEKWDIPPFSVLDARGGPWAKRKKEWLSLGIKSEQGRGDNLLKMSETVLEPDPEKRKARRAANAIPGGGGGGCYFAAGKPETQKYAKAFNTTDWIKEHGLSGGCASGEEGIASGTSIFDPVLCELSYRWFSPKGGVILDPFAGGSVRGIVAGLLDRRYFGCELRTEQVDANRLQVGLCPPEFQPYWHCGDSRYIQAHLASYGIVEPFADMLFSCPPYADLEVYSDDPADLSTLAYQDFKAAYTEIIVESCKALKDDRFAVFVVGEVRDKKGIYYNFVGDTITAFQEAGLGYYNEMILMTSTGSLAMRTDKQFMSSRAIGKTHQNVLVFIKGDRKKAAAYCNEADGLKKGTDQS